MNRKPLNEDSYANVVRAYADAIKVPHYNRQAVERRSPREGALRSPRWRQYAFATVVAVALIAWAAPAVPALIADVQSAMQLFLERNGQMTPATDRDVTIEQAARDLPFHVVPPSGVPLTATPAIHEVFVPNDPTSAHLMVQYASNLPGPKLFLTAMPALTIMETAASSPPANLAFSVHPMNKLPMAPPRGVLPPGAVRIRALSETWIESGTRITLLGTPGAITQAQLQQIRRAMGGY